MFWAVIQVDTQSSSSAISEQYNAFMVFALIEKLLLSSHLFLGLLTTEILIVTIYS